MNLTETYSGKNERFEGDLTLWLRTLPAGARATRATLTLQPPEEKLFREALAFTDGQGELGAEANIGANFIEVDFHARRTLARAEGSDGNFTLQVDMGGAWVGVAADGTFLSDSTAPWPVTLPATEDNLPALTVNRFRLTRTSNGGTLNLSEVQVRAVPSNLQVRLGQMAPFWVRLGELATVAASPDFSEVLNFYLGTLEAKDGFFQVPLTIHSDSLARLEATLSVDYIIEQAVLPPHLTEVNLPFDYGTLPGADDSLLTARLPRGAVPVKGRTQAGIRGTFNPSRLALGDPGDMPALGVVTVSPQCSLAQPLAAEAEIALTGIDLPLANTRPGLASLHLSLVADADGKPSGEILAEADVKVAKPLPDGRVWGSATLPAPFRILPSVRNWLVLQSREGEAYWSVAAGSAEQPTVQCSRDGGLSWRAAGGQGLTPPLAAQLRLRHVPERFKMPVQLQIGTGAGAVRRRLDEFAPAGKVEFSFDFADKLKEHLDSPEVGPACGGGSPLCNEDFTKPAPADATRRLFGFDSKKEWEIIGEVDLSRGINLSVERFLTLSLDDGPARRIDCAGAVPSRTALSEIVQAINRTVGASVASEEMINGTSGDPQGTGHLYLVSPQGDNGDLTLHPWCQRGLPECWQGSGDLVQRFRRSGREEMTVLLADPDLLPALSIRLGSEKNPIPLACFAEPGLGVSAAGGARLNQRFAVTPECSYRLGFAYSVVASQASDEKGCKPESLVAPSWELEWFDGSGTSLDKAGGHLETTAATFNAAPAGPVDERLTAPAGAGKAELRLLHPAASGYGLLLGGLSFVPTPQALDNVDFSQWEGPFGAQVPAGWTVQSGWLEQGSVPGKSDGVLLVGSGAAPEDAVLEQTQSVKAGTDYELKVRARALPFGTVEDENRPLQSRPRLELRWLADASLGEVLTLPLDGPGFTGRALAVTASEGAIRAELKLIQPLGEGDLLVEEVQFVKADKVDVPLIFLGEAPGELKVSVLRVAYDLPASPQSVQTASQARPLSPEYSTLSLADQPAAIVAGVGRRYTSILAEQAVPIRTIGQLAAMDTTVEIEGIALERRLEIKASAEMILDFAAECARFVALFREPIVTLLTADPEVLSRCNGQPVEQVRQLQKKLRAQHLLLNNKTLFGMTFEDLCARRSEAKHKENEP
jgi:hypothetical protein